MRFIDEIIVHCADTRTNQSFSSEDVKQWHLDRGFSDIGYHYYIRLSGDLEKGRDLDKAGAHCRAKGKNKNTIGICFEGGKDENNNKWNKPNKDQLNTFVELRCCLEFVLCKSLVVSGHCDYDKGKTCPNFDVKILTNSL